MQSPPPDESARNAALRTGFTLIEISIVLVIIGLIVGGVLVGQDLIRAAGERAQITQIEKFNQAVNTFYGKYGALPGDMNNTIASQFGFTARGQYAGQGDGNGVLEGVSGNCAGCNGGAIVDSGETGLFWVDLTTANGLNLDLIEGSFSTATITAVGSAITGAALGNYFPAAKIGGGNYIYVFSQGFGSYQYPGVNYFELSAVTSSDSGAGVNANPGLTVKQAYDIDRKIDDGLPQYGKVRALYMNRASGFVAAIWAGTTSSNDPYTWATPASATTCFDNGNTAGTQQQYSVKQNGGSGVNCTLSFQFQ